MYSRITNNKYFRKNSIAFLSIEIFIYMKKCNKLAIIDMEYFAYILIMKYKLDKAYPSRKEFLAKYTFIVFFIKYICIVSSVK